MLAKNYSNNLHNNNNVIITNRKPSRDENETDEEDEENSRDARRRKHFAQGGLWVRSRVLRYEDREYMAKYSSPFKIYPAHTFLPSKDLLTDCSESYLETEELILYVCFFNSTIV